MNRFCYLILNYETYEEALACAESVRQTAGAGLAEGRDHIVIVDNGSSAKNLAGLKKGLALLDIEKSVAEAGIPSYVTLIEAGQNLGFAKGNNLGFAYAIAGCIGISMLCAMIIASCMGTLIPMTLKKLGVDPAVASGPLITTTNDLIAVVAYYSLSWVLLINVLHLGG